MPNSRRRIRVTCVCLVDPHRHLHQLSNVYPFDVNVMTGLEIDWSISPVCPIKFLPTSSVNGGKKVVEGKTYTVIEGDEEKREGRCIESTEGQCREIGHG